MARLSTRHRIQETRLRFPYRRRPSTAILLSIFRYLPSTPVNQRYVADDDGDGDDDEEDDYDEAMIVDDNGMMDKSIYRSIDHPTVG